MFELGSYVVCPGHGVGQVMEIETKNINNIDTSFYIIKLISNGMKVMIPTESKDGIRALVSDEEVTDVFSLLKDHDVKVDNSTWNRRHRDYLAKVKTGSLLEIADVLRALFLLRESKKLSFGERKMMDQCKDLLVREIAITTGKQEKEVHSNIDSIFEN